MTLPRSEARPPTLLAALLHSPHLRLPACSSHFSPSRFLPLPIIPCLFPQLSFSAPAHPPPRSLSAPGLPRHDRLPHPPSSSPRALPVPPCSSSPQAFSSITPPQPLVVPFHSCLPRRDRHSRHSACHRRTCRLHTRHCCTCCRPACPRRTLRPACRCRISYRCPACCRCSVLPCRRAACRRHICRLLAAPPSLP